MILLGDFNWDLLSLSSCDSLRLVQVINSTTRMNQKDIDWSTLLDLILTNTPHRYSASGVFFVMALAITVQLSVWEIVKLLKLHRVIYIKDFFKHFNDQAFLHDLHNSDLGVVSCMPDVTLAWDYFKSTIISICDKHIPIKRFRISGKDNPWFNNTVSTNLKQRNATWAKAKKSNNSLDWTTYRALRNKCTKLIKSAKRDYYLHATNENLNNQTFCKLVKSTSLSNLSSKFPDHHKISHTVVKGREVIADTFNIFFISAGSTSESINSSATCKDIAELIQNCPPQSFNLVPITTSMVHKALMKLDIKKGRNL